MARANTMVANLSGVSDQVMMKIFQNQCCSFYGCQPWCLVDNYVASFPKLCNRYVKQTSSLP